MPDFDIWAVIHKERIIYDYVTGIVYGFNAQCMAEQMWNENTVEGTAIGTEEIGDETHVYKYTVSLIPICTSVSDVADHCLHFFSGFCEKIHLIKTNIRVTEKQLINFQPKLR